MPYLDLKINDINTYLNVLHNEIGGKYKFSTTPLFLNATLYQNIKQASLIVLQTLNQCKNNIQSSNTHLKKIQITEDDMYGCIDYHVQSEQFKIIEINTFPPGLASFIELMEENYNKLVLKSKGICTSKGFQEKTINHLSDNHTKKNILLCDYDIENEYSLNEYKYIKKILNKDNINVDLMSAEKIKLNQTGQIRGYENIDRIYNRLILSSWLKHIDELSNYTKYYNNNPEQFYINPFTWKLAHKDYINTIKSHAIQIDKKSVQNIFLKTNKISDYNNFESFKKDYPTRSKVIIKPIDNFGSKGVLLKPSNKTIIEYIDSSESKNLIVQELFKASKIKYLQQNGDMRDMKYDLRVVFMKQEIIGMYARIYEGGITNFSSDDGGFAPVFVINKS